MEKYKSIIKKRVWLFSLLIFAAVGVIVFEQFFAPEDVANSVLFGFQAGIMTALGLMAIFYIIKYRSLLNNEAKLKLEYNKENDERLKSIRSKAGLPAILITSVLMIIAGTVIGFFNITVFITLIAAAYFQMMFALIAKRIYMKKM